MKESTPLTLYVAYTAKPGCRETFVRQIVMEGIADTIRREEGCIRYDYYFSAQQEDEILLVEQWQTQAHQRHPFAAAPHGPSAGAEGAICGGHPAGPGDAGGSVI